MEFLFLLLGKVYLKKSEKIKIFVSLFLAKIFTAVIVIASLCTRKVNRRSRLPIASRRSSRPDCVHRYRFPVADTSLFSISSFAGAANTGAFRVESALTQKSAATWNPRWRQPVSHRCLLLLIAAHLFHNSVTRQLWYRFLVLSSATRRRRNYRARVGIIIIDCARTRSYAPAFLPPRGLTPPPQCTSGLMGHRGNDRKRARYNGVSPTSGGRVASQTHYTSSRIGALRTPLKINRLSRSSRNFGNKAIINEHSFLLQGRKTWLIPRKIWRKIASPVEHNERYMKMTYVAD